MTIETIINEVEHLSSSNQGAGAMATFRNGELEEVRKMLIRFEAEFWDRMKQAYKSGAFDPADHTPVEVGRCVMQIAANNFAPLSKPNKELLANLRHFV